MMTETAIILRAYLLNLFIREPKNLYTVKTVGNNTGFLPVLENLMNSLFFLEEFFVDLSN